MLNTISEYFTKNSGMYYYFKNGRLPLLFGSNMNDFISFIENNQINEDLLWDIISYPNVISNKGFNLYIIDAIDSSNVKLKISNWLSK